jgi:hypothetical protein
VRRAERKTAAPTAIGNGGNQKTKSARKPLPPARPPVNRRRRWRVDMALVVVEVIR